MAALFDFLKYEVLDAKYSYDDAKKQEVSDQIGAQVTLETHQIDKEKMRLAFRVVISGNPSIELELRGYFRINDEYVEGETEQKVQMFGSHILYPYVRAAVSALSSIGGRKPLILPVINVSEMFSVTNEIKNENTVLNNK